MIKNRGIKILEYILSNKEITIKELAELLDITERSVRYELEKIMTEFKEKKLITLKKGVVYLESVEKVENILNEIYCEESFTHDERDIYILLSIFFNGKINISELVKELELSRTTIKTHITNCKNFLNLDDLELKASRNGLVLIGEEENIRRSFLKLLIKERTIKNRFLKKYIRNIFEIKDDGIELFLSYCQSRMEKIISDEAFYIIKTYMKVVIDRVKKGRCLEKIKNEKFLKETNEFLVIKQGLVLIEAHYKIFLPDIEALKIVDYFLGSHTYNISYSYFENWVEIELLVKKVIEKFDSYIDEDILKDSVLYDGLINHIKPTIYRIKNGIELENSIYTEVMESYGELYRLTSLSLEEIENFIDKEFTKDEIAFITIHFKAAIDRNRIKNKEKKKILVVCGLGYGASNLLAQQLKENFSVEIVDTIPRHLLEKTLEEKNIDFIVTNLDGIENDKVIKVNAFMTNKDIEKIYKKGVLKRGRKVLLSKIIEAVDDCCEIKNIDKLYKKMKELLDINIVDDIFQKKVTISDYIKKEMIEKNVIIKNWKDGVEKAGDILYRNGYVEKEYIKEMIKIIESYGSYMVLGPEVIFPHAKSKHMVNRTGFSIVELKEKVEFPGNKKVKTIIAFSSKDGREHLEIFLQLVELVNKKGFKLSEIVKKIE